ncbi:melatonin receptor type 1A-like [Anneissia japonica]|uniref:melatonin receptor type 1A-like n=1 Tax=Anneissia japonica TaxID=1529436 RepID=UPI00142581E8|nr:melatonin receptor type 1A-like [Anneissia japonica]
MTTSACDCTDNYATNSVWITNDVMYTKWPNDTMETLLKPTGESFNEVQLHPSSLEFRRPSILNQYIEMSLLSAIMVIGILGNILVLVVYYKNRFKKQSTANYFLCSLVVSDLIVCISVIPLHLYLEVTSIYRFIKDIECQISLFIWNQTLLCSSWILVGISIDRYLAIRYPLETKIDAKKAKFMVVGIWVMSVIVASPSLMIFVGPRCTLMETTAFPLFFTTAILHSLVAMYIPLVIIIAAYLQIFYLLSKRKKHSKRQIGCQKLINNTRTIVAKRLFLVIIVYIICWLPRAVLKIHLSFTTGDRTDSNSRDLILYLIEYFLPYLNSLLNPVLYFMINKSFRRQCRRIFCCYYRCVCCRAERTAYTLQKTSMLLRMNSSFKNTTFRNLALNQ